MTVKIFDVDYVHSNMTNYYSSSDSVNTQLNLYDKGRRSKVWRSLQYFTFTDESTGAGITIKFKEAVADGGAGTTLTTSTLTATYTTAASVATAMQTALNATAGKVFTYHVVYDTTYNKFQIYTDSYKQFSILFTQTPYLSTMMGWQATDSSYAGNLYAASAVIHQYEYLRWDLGTPINPTCFLAIGKGNEAIKLSSSATILLQGNTSNNWASPAYSEAIPYNENALLIYRSTGLHTVALRHWRLKIIDQQNPYGYIELSKVALTNELIFERGAVQFPFSESREDASDVLLTNSGQTLVNTRYQSKQFGFTFDGLTIADKEKLDEFYEEYGTSKAFFVLLDSDSVFSSSPETVLRYCKLTGGYQASLDVPKNWSAELTLREEL